MYHVCMYHVYKYHVHMTMIAVFVLYDPHSH